MIAGLESTFIDTVRSHLADLHPGREYSADEIMFMAMPIPDRVIEGRERA